MTARTAPPADRIIRSIGAITEVGGHEIEISVSIGISLMPAGAWEREVRAEDVLKAADEAMYVAKRSGKGRYSFAEPFATARAA